MKKKECSCLIYNCDILVDSALLSTFKYKYIADMKDPVTGETVGITSGDGSYGNKETCFFIKKIEETHKC